MGYSIAPSVGISVIQNDSTALALTDVTATKTYSGLTFSAAKAYRITLWVKATSASCIITPTLKVSDGTTATTLVADASESLSSSGVTMFQYLIHAENSATLTVANVFYSDTRNSTQTFKTTGTRVTLGGALSWTDQTIISIDLICSAADTGSCNRVIIEEITQA